MSNGDARDKDPGIEMSGGSCPLPCNDYPNIVLGHGGGGKLSSELVEQIFCPHSAMNIWRH